MTNRTRSLCIGAALLLAVLLQCDGEVFVRMSRIRLLVEHVYPPDDPDKAVYTNSAVVTTFNKTINKQKFKKSMLQVKGPDGNTIDGLVYIDGKTIVFTPDETTLLKKESKHTIEITKLIDTDGNVLKQASADFYTKDTPDTSMPLPLKATAQGNTVSVYFNEPLLNHRLQQDALTIADAVTSGQLRGTVSCVNFSNTLVFTAAAPLSADKKYIVSINTGRGIVDRADNEFTGDAVSFPLYPEHAQSDTLKVVSFYPGALYDVPMNSTMVITFNKTIDRASFTRDMIRVTSAYGVHKHGDISIGRKSIVITVNRDDENTCFRSDTLYSASVSGVMDTDGKKMKQQFVTFFKTGIMSDFNTAMPAAIYSDINALTVCFAEPLLLTEEALQNANENPAITVFDTEQQKNIPGTIMAGCFPDRLLFIPAEQLVRGRQYIVRIYDQYIYDLAGNIYDGPNFYRYDLTL